MEGPTFNLTIRDVEFVVWELPQDDEFTKDMHKWLAAQLKEQRETEERRRHGPGVVVGWSRLGPTLHVELAPPEGWPA